MERLQGSNSWIDDDDDHIILAFRVDDAWVEYRLNVNQAINVMDQMEQLTRRVRKF